MKKPKLLYISTNPGDCPRTTKEIRTLSNHFRIFYLGIGVAEDRSIFIKPFVENYFVAKGARYSILNLLKYYFGFLKLRLSNKFDSIHIINEQPLIIFYPFLLWSNNVVLDIFDSMFLKGKTKLSFLNNWFRSFLYFPLDHIIVTDNNRLNLMPKKFHKRMSVLENFPNIYSKPIKTRKDNSVLKIMFIGALSKSRGAEILLNLIQLGDDVKIGVVGWIRDDIAQKLSDHDNSEYYGVLPQDEVFGLSYDADYIMCCYEPLNANNINASPNKVYDAIQTETPVIINSEVVLSSFVKDNSLGIVLSDFYTVDPQSLKSELFEKRESFFKNSNLSEKYCWENQEKILIKIHNNEYD